MEIAQQIDGVGGKPPNDPRRADQQRYADNG
jgi:hypothetical protein